MCTLLEDKNQKEIKYMPMAKKSVSLIDNRFVIMNKMTEKIQ